MTVICSNGKPTKNVIINGVIYAGVAAMLVNHKGKKFPITLLAENDETYTILFDDRITKAYKDEITDIQLPL